LVVCPAAVAQGCSASVEDATSQPMVGNAVTFPPVIGKKEIIQ
jgi:hypothetical protein